MMKMTEKIASLSYDSKHQVGAILYKKDYSNIVSMGYNGNFAGGENKRDSMESGQSGFLHAEENVLIKANINNPKDYVMMVTMTPCKMCAKRIVNKEVREVIYLKDYANSDGGEEVFSKAGVNYYKMCDKIVEVLVANTRIFDDIVLESRNWNGYSNEDLQVAMSDMLYKHLDQFFEFDKSYLNRLPVITFETDDVIRKYLKKLAEVLYIVY